MWTRAELKTAAKEVLNANYWMSVVVSFILAVAIGAGGVGFRGGVPMTGSPSGMASGSGGDIDMTVLFIIIATVMLFAIMGMIIGMVFNAFVFMPIQVGCRRFFISCRDGRGIVDMVIFAFKEGKDAYFNIVKTMFLKQLKIVLWTLLFIIPGIIKAYEYYMIPYILADDPNTDCETAFEMSREMTDGEKMNIFVLELSFIGWHILNIFTLGLLGLFYVKPYVNLTFAELYHTLRAEYDQRNGGYNETAVSAETL